MKTSIAFVSYETIHAPCGGIAAVMQHLPEAVRRESKLPTLMITPHHHRIPKTRKLDLKSLGFVDAPSPRGLISVEVLRLSGALPVFFLKPEDETYFAGNRHPYDVPTGSGGEANVLLRDAFFFGVATAAALPLIAPDRKLALMLQDWEAATVALALSGHEHPHSIHVTMHNSYDSPAPSETLRDFRIAPGACRGHTVFQRALPLVEETVFTVSDQFAVDFFSDPLQRDVMAPHLQKLLKPRLKGVCNGPFVGLEVDRKLLTSAKRGDFKELRAWKRAQKRQALRALAKVEPGRETPVWGDPRAFAEEDAPWFVFAGRDDSRQKGYEVAVAAIRAFLKRRRDAKFLFFPIPGDEGLAGLSFLRKLAGAYPANVIAFPFIWREGFGASLCGAAYGVMPSLYEPFGMASEFYLKGTVGLARATGGLCQQIRPVEALASYSLDAARQAAPYHDPGSPPTGLLFREPLDLPGIAGDWRVLNESAYTRNKRQDRLQERGKLELIKRMATELKTALIDALDIHQTEPALYHGMLAHGVALVTKRFSWKHAARQYLEKIDV